MLLPSLEHDAVLHLNKRQSPLVENDLRQIWMKLAQWFLKEDFYTTITFFAILLLSHLDEGVVLHLNKHQFPFGQKTLAKKKIKIYKLFSLSSPLGRGRGPSFEQPPSPNKRPKSHTGHLTIRECTETWHHICISAAPS